VGEPIRILIIETQQFVADALEALLNQQPGMVVVGNLASIADSVTQAAQLSPDIVILDFRLNGVMAIAAAKAIAEARSEAKVIFMSRDETDHVILAAIDAGASAVLYMSTAAAKVIDAVRIVASGGSSSGAAAASTVAAATPTSFSQLPFTFTFNGGFFALEHLFQQLNGFTVRETSGGLRVSGRLLTMQSVKLVPVSASTGGSPGGQELSGTITATAYVLPPGQGLTGSATSTSPTGATTRAASTTGAASSPTPPAIARVTP